MIARFQDRPSLSSFTAGLASLLVLAWVTLTGASAAPRSPSVPPVVDLDTDGDGLSDFHERHKYLTDPGSPDSDRDGVPDGDWSERREFAYTVRSIVQVVPPVTRDVLQDDYQDARILEQTDAYVELEVIHYPRNTVAEAIGPNPHWRRDYAGMERWLAPGPTANWDRAMREELIRRLAEDGIDIEALDDREVVERASKWLLRHAESIDGFTTFSTHFVDGEPRVHPGRPCRQNPEASGTSGSHPYLIGG